MILKPIDYQITHIYSNGDRFILRWFYADGSWSEDWGKLRLIYRPGRGCRFEAVRR
jgi:hypothetical protein